MKQFKTKKILKNTCIIFYIIFGNVEHREDKLSANPEFMSYKSIYNTTLFQYFPDEVCTANEK